MDGLNTASIAYGTSGSIHAVVYFDGASSSTMYVMDPAIGTATITVTGLSGPPDVIIGNNDGSGLGTSSLTDYIIAVAHPTPASGGGGTNDVQVDFFDVYDDGSATLTVSTSATTSLSWTGYDAYTTHIDVLADANNLLPTGRPFCDRFLVTWDDHSSPNPVVYANDADLNTGTGGTVKQITTGTYYGQMPDVAMVTRTVSGSDHELGLISYVDRSNVKLYYAEYDVTAGSVSTPTPIDDVSGTMTANIQKPRIDAYDDPSYTPPTGRSSYKVVAQVYDGSYYQTRTYDDLLSSFSLNNYICSDVIDISSVPGYGTYSPSYNHYFPTVAVGSNSEKDYIVAQYTSYSVGNEIFFMEPIGSDIPYDIDHGYYWVNSSSGTPVNAAATSYASAICTPANEISLNSFYIWAFYTGSVIEVDYKLSGYPFAFRPAPLTNTAQSSSGDFRIYPNPAQHQVVLSGAYEEGKQCEYKISNMMGQVVLSGTITSAKHAVEVSSLAAGNYMVSVYGNGVRTKGTVLTKQ